MTIVIQRRHLLTTSALGTAGILISYASCASLNDTPHAAPQQLQHDVVDAASLVPVNRDDLNAAAELTRRFVTAYGTYRWDQTPNDYLTPLRPITNPELFEHLAKSANDTTVRAERSRQRTRTTASARVTGIRALQANSITFHVTGHQELRRGGRPEQTNDTFTVTLTRDTAGVGGAWKVHNLQAAAIGQPEDQPS